MKHDILPYNRGYLYALMTSVCFAINGMGIRFIFGSRQQLNPESAAIWGFLGALLLTVPYYIVSSGARKRMKVTLQRDIKTVSVISLITAVGAIFWVFAIKHAIVAGVSLLAKSMIIYSAILGYFFLKERLRLIEVLGFFTAIPGVVLISTLQGEVAPIAAAAVLFSAFVYAIQSLVVKKFATHLYGLEFTVLRAFFMVVLFFVPTYFSGRLQAISPDTFMLLAIVSFSGLIVGRAFYFEAHKYLEISRLNLTLLFEPVLVLLASSLLLREPLTLPKTIGAIFILSGLALVISGYRRNKKTDQILPDESVAVERVNIQ